MKNIHFKTCTCLLGILLILFSGIQVKGASLEVQQESKISGTVTDEKGEPVIGASVVVVESKQGTITDIDGKFLVNVPKNGHLKVSYIGYETQEVAVKNRQLLKIVLKEESTALNEVVVVGYGTMKRKEMTSAISHIGAKDLNQISSLDASMLLQGKVSSVSVSNTALADPNNQGSIQIRGVSSRNAGLGPLIVVDGVPGGDMTNINPADIESIDVLKDGAASAIYGTRGSNGVILINLKKGTKDGQVHTTYSTSVTFNKAKKELDIMNAEEYRAYRTVSNPLSDMGADSDWFDAVTQLGVTHMHTLTFSGGNARTNYRVTADYRNARGIDLRSDRREYGASTRRAGASTAAAAHPQASPAAAGARAGSDAARAAPVTPLKANASSGRPLQQRASSAAAQAITPGRKKPKLLPPSAAATAADKIRLPMPGFSGGKRRRPYPAAAASRASPPQNRMV